MGDTPGHGARITLPPWAKVDEAVVSSFAGFFGFGGGGGKDAAPTTATATASGTATKKATDGGGNKTYIVRGGDTMYDIAMAHDVRRGRGSRSPSQFTHQSSPLELLKQLP